MTYEPFPRIAHLGDAKVNRIPYNVFMEVKMKRESAEKIFRSLRKYPISGVVSLDIVPAWNGNGDGIRVEYVTGEIVQWAGEISVRAIRYRIRSDNS